MSGVQAQTAGDNAGGGGLQAFKSLCCGGGVGSCISVLAGVQFDAVESLLGREGYLFFFRIDERADKRTGGFEATDGVDDAVGLVGQVDAAFGGDLGATFGDERRLIRGRPDGDIDNLSREAHLQIEFDVYGLPQDCQVAIGNMPAILAQMNGDGVGAAQFRFGGRPDRVRLVRLASLTQRGDVIDIDTEFHHDSYDFSWSARIYRAGRR